MRFLLFLPGILLLIISFISAVRKSGNPKPPQEEDDSPDVFVGYIITHDHNHD